MFVLAGHLHCITLVSDSQSIEFVFLEEGIVDSLITLKFVHCDVDVKSMICVEPRLI